jgi:glycosyltransferase involved in cell wall biosynthesis
MTKKINKKLRIAQVAPLWFSIPPKKYGGTERIVSYLTEELVRRGHDVTLFASGDSKTNAKLVSVTKKGLISEGVPWSDYTWTGLNTGVAFENANKFDIIHCHWGFFPVFFQKFVKTPVVYTFHNIPKYKDHRWKILNYYKKDINVVFISNSEKKNSPIKFKKNWTVYNGIDISNLKFNKEKNNNFVWIGRIDPVKGIENAIKVAKKLDLNLFLAGQVQEMRKDYFKKIIKPNLSDKIKYLGELSQSQLSNFYGNAKACLYPIEWEEPFGLVMAEAMACGTPVIVFDRGSAKEVVKNGETGFVVKDTDEMIRAIKHIDGINRLACRKRVEENFTYQRMVSDYEKIYYEILKSKNKK